VKFSSVVSIQIFSLKNANPSFYKIHVENDYFPLPSKFEMLGFSAQRAVPSRSTSCDLRYELSTTLECEWKYPLPIWLTSRGPL
jgi:hypothetical protein